MLFNSIAFLVFFAIIVVIYFNIPQRFRWIILLISSYYFYMTWKPEYIILIMISTFIDYVSAIQMHRTGSQKIKNMYLMISIISNLGLLFAFKYFNFFSDSAREILQKFAIQLDPMTMKILLPVGISFYTFQTMSYTIDVYRGKIKPEKHLGIFAVYVSFFPQLVAGPIERASNLLPQFFEKHNFDPKMATAGLKLILWGLFKKIVIADRLSVVVNTIYSDPTNYTGLPLILATIFFAFQIYCDFSGYSDIAIGSAQVMGFRLMKNFNRPYLSRSVTEFWRRWHISLSTWFKDYLYIPIGGNRVSVPRWYLNLLIVFIISGLWHGANWTFLMWGFLHACFMIIEAFTKPTKEKVYNMLTITRFSKMIMLGEIVFTFILVNLAWVFFRANSISDAIYILTHMFKGMQGINFQFNSLYIGIGWGDLFIAFLMIALMELYHLIQEITGKDDFIEYRHTAIRWGFYIMILIFIIFFGETGTQFIYFQF